MVRWLIALTLAMVESAALACQCSKWPSAPEAWQSASAVFLGHVVLAIPGKSWPGTQALLVRVEEPFKGVRRHELLFFLQPDEGCTPKYSSGERAMFYAGESGPGIWESPGCFRSRTLELAADDLLFLRALPGSATRSRIAGTVALMLPGRNGEYRGIPGVQVTIAGGSRRLKTMTNADGVYELYDVPPGRYTAAIEAPNGLGVALAIPMGVSRMDPDYRQKALTIGPSMGLGVDFYLRTATGAAQE